MRSRLRYIAVLVVSAVAIVLGAWPSLLTVGAVIGFGTASVALIALVRPSVVESRVVLRRFALWGGVILSLELLAFAAWMALTPRRTVHVAAPSISARLVRIVYGVSDGVSSPAWRWDRYFTADTISLSLIHTRLDADDGWFRKEHPHRVIARTQNGMIVPARWIAGGLHWSARHPHDSSFE